MNETVQIYADCVVVIRVVERSEVEDHGRMKNHLLPLGANSGLIRYNEANGNYWLPLRIPVPFLDYSESIAAPGVSFQKVPLR